MSSFLGSQKCEDVRNRRCQESIRDPSHSENHMLDRQAAFLVALTSTQGSGLGFRV